MQLSRLEGNKVEEIITAVKSVRDLKRLSVPTFDENDFSSARGQHMESHRMLNGESEQISPRVGVRGQQDKAASKLKTAAECEMFKIVKLGKKLGEGAYGCVFQALWQQHHKFIVVKKIKVA